MDTALRNRIYPAKSADDLHAAATIVAEAFTPLPVSQYLVPDRRERMSILTDVFEIHIAHATDFGTVDLLAQVSRDRCIGGGAGVAVWVDQTQPVPEPPDYERRLLQATRRHYSRFVLLDLLFAKHHPSRPHHHLALLAVAPGLQSAGIGTALLRHHHEQLDRDGVGAYLEASSPESARLYQRHGYERSGPDLELAPGAGFIPMWRGHRREENG